MTRFAIATPSREDEYEFTAISSYGTKLASRSPAVKENVTASEAADIPVAGRRTSTVRFPLYVRPISKGSHVPPSTRICSPSTTLPSWK